MDDIKITDPKTLLKRIVSLIDRDLTLMEELNVKLSPDDTMALSRYGKTLIEVISQQTVDEDRQRELIGRMNEQQLREAALKAAMDGNS